jgi:predicted RNase H-like HicB family nuclease
MTRVRTVLRFDLEATIEERDGYFAAFTEPFAVTVYGDTELQVEERAKEAVLLLLRRHSTRPKELSEYLGRLGIKHLLETTQMETKQHHPIVRECKQEVRVEVPAGA